MKSIPGYMVILILLTNLLSVAVKAQESSEYYNRTISGLFNRIIQSDSDKTRGEFSDSLTIVIESYLNDNYPFDHNLDGGRYLGQIYAPDSLVKLISFNTAFLDGSNRYTTFIVKRSDQGRDYWLVNSEQGLDQASSESEISSSEWYGALYYEIRSFVRGDSTLYLIIGLDINGLLTNSKVIDILWFNSDNRPVFGSPLINIRNRIYHRMIFKYSAQVSMMVRYDSVLDRVVFDHLSPSSPRFEGEYQYYGPDFSYDALELKDGLWWFIEDIDLRNRE
jgi:hypothetical protein